MTPFSAAAPNTINLPMADPAGQSQLPSHLLDCTAARTPLHGLRSLMELTDGFLTPRFASTLAVLVLLASALAWLVH